MLRDIDSCTAKVINYITRLRHRYFVLVVDIICIGHITGYIARNVRHILQSFVMVVAIICIGHITSYLARKIHHILHIY